MTGSGSQRRRGWGLVLLMSVLAWVLLIWLVLLGIRAASGQTLIPNGQQTFLGANGTPLSGGFVFMYVPSTTTPKTTWQDQGLSVANTNPIVLDANGQGRIWGTGTYRQVLQDSLGNVIWDQLTTAPSPSGAIVGSGSANAGDVLCSSTSGAILGARVCSSGTWTPYTPVVTCLTLGPLANATVVGEFLRLGRQISFNINIGIVTNGTCAGAWNISLPAIASGTLVSVVTLRTDPSGVSGNCKIQFNILLCNKYDGTYAGGDATSSQISGVYQASTN